MRTACRRCITRGPAGLTFLITTAGPAPTAAQVDLLARQSATVVDTLTELHAVIQAVAWLLTAIGFLATAAALTLGQERFSWILNVSASIAAVALSASVILFLVAPA